MLSKDGENGGIREEREKKGGREVEHFSSGLRDQKMLLCLQDPSKPRAIVINIF